MKYTANDTESSFPSRATSNLAQSAASFTHQAEKLSRQSGDAQSLAIEARFVTPQDAVIVTTDGSRLPGVPVHEAHKLNNLRQELQGHSPEIEKEKEAEARTGQDASHRVEQSGAPCLENAGNAHASASQTLRHSMPPSHTNPLFPPLPLYGPPTPLRKIQCYCFRISSFFLSLAFLAVIVSGSLFCTIPVVVQSTFYRLTLRNVDERRPFFDEETRRADVRHQKRKDWERRESIGRLGADKEGTADEYPPTEGGKDPIICNVGYYARRVGLDVETIQVQTEDGFIIELWHVYDPKEYTSTKDQDKNQQTHSASRPKHAPADAAKKPRFPVLLMHGLLQSSGAYCCNDDDSLAFWLCKSGFDVWLGNNRCGFEPKHSVLEYSDPRMWCWNIRQMGVFDLAALTDRVLSETEFSKLGLICHSQGTTQTFVALAKEQRPDLGEKLTVFCALAPAAYAGPLIGKMYFKFMRIISPGMFRLMFGIHAFIPFMMQMHRTLPPKLYGWMGYKVFSFLFDWSDTRWDRGLRNRMFQFAPVYVSAESMRWWLGRECFAKHKCILATKETTKAEEAMDGSVGEPGTSESPSDDEPRVGKSGATAWYNHQVPPFALWVCGNDDLVDGRKLLRRFEKGREPHVKVVHSKIIDSYEHLDVIWAMDAVDQVFKEVRQTLWKTCDVRHACRVPLGCEGLDVGVSCDE
ncbi:hypothetical protein CDD81_7171 [Ophiocordyceps australis]|uniref:Partial AB-hydrolase lipase domain-containing protein n=1 Tax=Ophiocordyceps australis TaxID=1399860 RepID=A0A2C5XYN5_9HYPO|nr:hypothetical protein CDD81_7171 [Ophiocordyceps australis]